MSSRADDSDADEASEHADESAGPRIARRIWGPVTKDVSESIGAPAAVASLPVRHRGLGVRSRVFLRPAAFCGSFIPSARRSCLVREWDFFSCLSRSLALVPLERVHSYPVLTRADRVMSSQQS